MKLPRDESAEKLVKRLNRLGYKVIRQSGSHIRLELEGKDGILPLTIPNHSDLKIGTLSAILRLAASQLGVDKETLLRQLFK